jgi:hypothetical protein
MWAISRFDLGLSDKDAGELTISMFEALLDRKMASNNREKLNAGIVAASIYNANPFRGEDAKVASPLDFVPELRDKQEQYQGPDLTQMTPEEQKNYLLLELGKKTYRRK